MSPEDGISISLNAPEIMDRMVEKICEHGVTPVIAVEHAIENQLYCSTINALGGRLIKKPVIRFHSNYYVERYASIHRLSEIGYHTWYATIIFATHIDDGVENLEIATNGVELIPYDFAAWEVHRRTALKVRAMKRQIKHEFRVNFLRLGGAFFKEIEDKLRDNECYQKKPSLIANLSPGPVIQGYRLVSFDDEITGLRKYCSCAKEFHQSVLNNALFKVPNYVAGSWPGIVVSMLKNALYEDDLCHLCLAKRNSIEEAVDRYGKSVEQNFEAYVDQVCYDLTVDQKTAKAEVKLLLGLSRWVREAELYRIIRELFPNARVLREASPKWLGRMRFDIYLPDLNLAIEHQGAQHYHSIKIFGGEDAHRRVLELDGLKRKLCEENGIEVVDVRYDAPLTKAAIRHRLQRYLKN